MSHTLSTEESFSGHPLRFYADHQTIVGMVGAELAKVTGYDEERLDRLLVWESGLDARAREAHKRGMRPGEFVALCPPFAG